MAWSFEIRGSENRLIEVRSGYATQLEARAAGRRIKRMIDCLCYPNFEPLTLLTKEDLSMLSPIAQMTSLPGELSDPPPAKPVVNLKLKYPWQQLVVAAFLEPHAENLPGKINIAERGLSARLLDAAPFELDERLALGESLLALRQLLNELKAVSGSVSQKDIA